MEKLGKYFDNEWFILINIETGICNPFSIPRIRNEWLPVEGPFKSKSATEARLKEICIEFQNRFYLKREKDLLHMQMVSRASHRADLSICKSYEKQILSDDEGWNRFKGECATGVQYVCHKSNDSIGTTSGWREGSKVRGNHIPSGTAIATFRNGVYADDHAAILIEEVSEGLKVWDQFNTPSKPWGIRILHFDYSGSHPYSNDGDLFNVILS